MYACMYMDGPPRKWTIQNRIWLTWGLTDHQHIKFPPHWPFCDTHKCSRSKPSSGSLLLRGYTDTTTTTDIQNTMTMFWLGKSLVSSWTGVLVAVLLVLLHLSPVKTSPTNRTSCVESPVSPQGNRNLTRRLPICNSTDVCMDYLYDFWYLM